MTHESPNRIWACEIICGCKAARVVYPNNGASWINNSGPAQGWTKVWLHWINLEVASCPLRRISFSENKQRCTQCGPTTWEWRLCPALWHMIDLASGLRAIPILLQRAYRLINRVWLTAGEREWEWKITNFQHQGSLSAFYAHHTTTTHPFYCFPFESPDRISFTLLSFPLPSLCLNIWYNMPLVYKKLTVTMWLYTGVKLFIGSKIPCMFCFNICTHFRGERSRKGRECKCRNKAHRTFDPRNIFSPVLHSRGERGRKGRKYKF